MASSGAFFFPRQLPLDTAGMYPQRKILFQELCQLSETQVRLRRAPLSQELEHPWPATAQEPSRRGAKRSGLASKNLTVFRPPSRAAGEG